MEKAYDYIVKIMNECGHWRDILNKKENYSWRSKEIRSETKKIETVRQRPNKIHWNFKIDQEKKVMNVQGGSWKCRR